MMEKILPYDTARYKIWTWKHPLMLHWIINPGLAINELVFGQRIPKIFLVERDKSKPFSERTFIPCPHCGTLHSGLKWTVESKSTFGDWFGLYCSDCGKIIPCLTNLTSYLILGLSFPFWIWFKEKWKAEWLEKQKDNFSKPKDHDSGKSTDTIAWWKVGVFFGLSMFVIMTILFPLIFGERITLMSLLAGVLIWSVSGLLFALLLKYFWNRI